MGSALQKLGLFRSQRNLCPLFHRDHFFFLLHLDVWFQIQKIRPPIHLFHHPTKENQAFKMESEDTSLWVFGYGSLCWNPGFTYGKSVIGSIQGFSRRFWQGNTTHRGVPGKPGREATLVEDSVEASTYGVAFQLLGESALEYLNKREVTLGGYATHITLFQPRDPTVAPFPVLLFVATPSNEHWLGKGPLDQIAHQVVHSSGNSGHNVEYVLKIAMWQRHFLPDIQDDHLYTLEHHIRNLVDKEKMDLKSLMGQELAFATSEQPTASDNDDLSRTPSKSRRTSGDFTSQVTQED